jgi:SpoIIAA-like
MHGRGLASPGIPEILRSVGGVVEQLEPFSPHLGVIAATSRDSDERSFRHNPCYSESMPIGLEQEADSIFRIEMRGMLRKADLDRCQARLAAEMSRLGPVRLLFVLDEFAGWEPRDNWSDLTFYAKYSDCIDRIAIVGDERWRSEALMFAGAELRRAPVEYFAGSSREDDGARAWLSA